MRMAMAHAEEVRGQADAALATPTRSAWTIPWAAC